MGYWFGEYNSKLNWNKSTTKINGNRYTSRGNLIKNPSSYFQAVKRNGKYWTGNTGWEKNKEEYKRHWRRTNR